MGTSQALDTRRFGVATRARWVGVRIETDTATYVGRVYVPETKRRVSDLLSDDRPFVHLTEVVDPTTSNREAFIAINKRFIRTVRVLDEPELEVSPAR